jgi:hypothetical protein
MDLSNPQTFLILAETIVLDIECKVNTPAHSIRNYVALELCELSQEQLSRMCEYFNSKLYLEEKTPYEVHPLDILGQDPS